MGKVDFSTMSVMIVDDEKFSLRIVGQILKSIGFKRVVEAKDGSHALAQLEGGLNEDINLVIADFNMPIVNGLELLKTIRVGMKGVDRAMTVAMLTGNTDKHLVAAAIDLDVDAFIAKPVSRDVLEKKLSRILQNDIELKEPKSYQDVDIDVQIAIRADEKKDIEHFGSAVLSSKNEAHEVLLSRVQEGTVLARSVRLSDGKVILQAGIKLNDRLIAKVQDLNALGEKIETVWVE